MPGSPSDAGQAGETVGGEAGASSGGTSGGTGGKGGAGGSGGTAGTGGKGGAGGSAGSSGSGGAGGSGGSLSTGYGGAPPCTGTPSTVQASDLVLIDGGSNKRDTAWGGAPKLNQACQDALAKLTLPQTAALALIVASGVSTEAPAVWSVNRTDVAFGSRVVGPTGIELASSYVSLLTVGPKQSLVCGGVFAPDVKTWATGSTTCNGLTDSPPNTCLAASSSNQSQFNCSDWKLGSYDSEIIGRVGYTTFTDKRWIWGDFETRPFAGVSCNVPVHIMCLAYTPVP
jgi:hypothetical protein